MITTKQALEIYGALVISSKVEKLDGTVNYALARNMNKLKKINEQFHEDDTERIKAFVKKGPDGTFLTKNGQWVFGENQKIAEEKLKELMDKEIEFDPYTIKKSEHTDILPAIAQAELLDIIIIEK